MTYTGWMEMFMTDTAFVGRFVVFLYQVFFTKNTLCKAKHLMKGTVFLNEWCPI